MIENIRIRQIYTGSLSCEPILRRTKNGELLCICQCDGPCEPHEDNRVYAFHSTDNGETWSEKVKIYPEDSNAVYCTEVSVDGDEITAYLTVHSGRFLDWKCLMYKSFDNGYTWENFGPPPHFEEYTFIRGKINTKNSDIVIPYQHYPITKEQYNSVMSDESNQNKCIADTKAEYCETGVLVSKDNSKTYQRYVAAKIDMNDSWVWSEPTVVELGDSRLAMLLRKDGSKFLWYTESYDGGQNWAELKKTDIPNPSNKPKLIKTSDKIFLLHTPNNSGMETTQWGKRFPLSLWISNNDMKSWDEKYVLTDFPGNYSYSDGFYEKGHIMFTVEHNRHTILFFDVCIEE